MPCRNRTPRNMSSISWLFIALTPQGIRGEGDDRIPTRAARVRERTDHRSPGRVGPGPPSPRRLSGRLQRDALQDHTLPAEDDHTAAPAEGAEESKPDQLGPGSTVTALELHSDRSCPELGTSDRGLLN